MTYGMRITSRILFVLGFEYHESLANSDVWRYRGRLFVILYKSGAVAAYFKMDASANDKRDPMVKWGEVMYRYPSRVAEIMIYQTMIDRRMKNLREQAQQLSLLRE